VRALLLTDSDVFAGTERHVLDLAVGLQLRGWPVVVGCPAGSPLAARVEEGAIEHRAVEKRGALDRRVVRQLAGWLRRGEIELIHAHNGRTALHAALATRQAGTGAVVFTQHFIQPSRTGRRGLKKWASGMVHGWVSERIHHTIAISTAVRDAALARGDAPADRISVVHNGIRDPGGDVQRLPSEVRQALDVPEEAPLLVCAARLQPEKDVATLLKAMQSVAAEIPGCVCLIAGQGMEAEALERRIADLALGERVRLLGFREDVRELIAAADLFVLPAKAEPFGLVLLEAMALGRPVIATRAGGPLDIVVDGLTGRLVEPMNPKVMAQAIIESLRDRQWLDRAGQAGRRRFEERFTAERMAMATQAIYGRVLAGAAPPTASLTPAGTD